MQCCSKGFLLLSCAMLKTSATKDTKRLVLSSEDQIKTWLGWFCGWEKMQWLGNPVFHGRWSRRCEDMRYFKASSLSCTNIWCRNLTLQLEQRFTVVEAFNSPSRCFKLAFVEARSKDWSNSRSGAQTYELVGLRTTLARKCVKTVWMLGASFSIWTSPDGFDSLQLQFNTTPNPKTSFWSSQKKRKPSTRSQSKKDFQPRIHPKKRPFVTGHALLKAFSLMNSLINGEAKALTFGDQWRSVFKSSEKMLRKKQTKQNVFKKNTRLYTQHFIFIFLCHDMNRLRLFCFTGAPWARLFEHRRWQLDATWWRSCSLTVTSLGWLLGNISGNHGFDCTIKYGCFL